MNRRSLLLTPLALGACGANVQVPSAYAADAALIDTLVQIEGPVLLAKPGLSVTDANNITAAMAAVHQAAVVLASTQDLSANAQIVAGMQAVADVAARYFPPGSQEALQIAAAVRIATLFLPVGTASAGVTAGMSLEEARVRLRGIRR